MSWHSIRTTLSGLTLYNLGGEADPAAKPKASDSPWTALDGDAKAQKLQLDAVYARVGRALLPIFFLMVILNYIDRTNLAFASIQLNAALGFTASTYGLGSGLFFLGYGLCQVPSNLILMRVGAPAWLSIVIVAWGICATSFATISTTNGFYLLRFLLGVTEAGAFPGMWYYLSMWYPEDRVTGPYALMEAAMCLSHVIAGPLAASLLAADGVMGLRGWQWLFIVEGLPSIALGFCIRFWLPDCPNAATFLSSDEQALIQQQVAGTQGGKPARPRASGRLLLEVLANRWLWFYGCVKIVKDIAVFGMIFWAPTLIQAILNGQALDMSAHGGHGRHGSGVTAVLLTSVPFTLAATVSLWVGHRSEAANERPMHIAIPWMTAGFVFSWFPALVARSATLGFLSLTVGITGAYAGVAPMLATVASVMPGPAVGVALPFFNSIGCLGGLLGPYMVGYLVDATGGFALAATLMGLLLMTAGALVAASKPYSAKGHALAAAKDGSN